MVDACSAHCQDQFSSGYRIRESVVERLKLICVVELTADGEKAKQAHTLVASVGRLP